MSQLITNDFSSFDLTEEEELQGTLLTVTQVQVIQNHLSAVAAEKIALEYDSANPILFAQQEAYKKGQLETYRFILDSHEAAKQRLLELKEPPTQ